MRQLEKVEIELGPEGSIEIIQGDKVIKVYDVQRFVCALNEARIEMLENRISDLESVVYYDNEC